MAVNPQMVVRIAANVEELKKNLREGRDSIETTTAAMAKMASSLQGDKLIIAAHNMTAAVREVGGAAKLTEQEKARLNATLEKAIAKYTALGKEAPAAMRQLATETAKSSSLFERMTSALGPLGTALAGAFSIGAIMNFGRELLRMGDEIVRVSDRTGLTTDEVQRLQYVAEQSGNTLDQLTGSIGQLQNRLASGDKSAVAATKALNLNLAELVKMGPYQQFELIATAVGKIQNPMEQAQVAMDLFGRAGIEILPTLKAHFEALSTDAPVMSDKTVRALESAGDALNRFKLTIKVAAAESYNYARGLFDGLIAWAMRVIGSFHDLIASAMEMAAKIPGATKLIPGLAGEVKHLREQAQYYRDAATMMSIKTEDVGATAKKATPLLLGLGAAAEEAGKKKDEAAKAAKKFKEELAKNTETVKQLEYGLQGTAKGVEDLGRMGADTTPKLQTLREEVERLQRGGQMMSAYWKEAGVQIGHLVSDNTVDAARRVGDALEDGAAASRSLKDSLKSLVSGDLKSVFKDIGGFLKGGLSSIGTGILEGIGTNILQGITNLAMKGISALGGAIKKLFGGPSKAELEGRAVFGDFEKSFGGFEQMMAGIGKAYEATGRSAAQAEADVRRLQDSVKKGAEATRDALAVIAAAMDEQKQDAEDLRAAVERYGFTIDELGPIMRRQQLSEQASQLMNDFRLLAGSGIDLNVVLDHMAPAINEFVNTAIRTGTEIPAAMKPVIEQMVQHGELIDANGNKFTSLEGTGLTFAETMTQGFDRIVAKLNELLERLELVPRAAQSAASSIPSNPFSGWHVPDLNLPSSGDLGFGGFQATGGDYFVTKPTMFIAGEAGPERASFSGGNRGGAAVDLAVLESEIKGLRRDLKRQPRELAAQLVAQRAIRGSR